MPQGYRARPGGAPDGRSAGPPPVMSNFGDALFDEGGKEPPKTSHKTASSKKATTKKAASKKKGARKKASASHAAEDGELELQPPADAALPGGSSTAAEGADREPPLDEGSEGESESPSPRKKAKKKAAKKSSRKKASRK